VWEPVWLGTVRAGGRQRWLGRRTLLAAGSTNDGEEGAEKGWRFMGVSKREREREKCTWVNREWEREVFFSAESRAED